MDENEFELFETNRKNGENEDYVCTMIRNDSIDEFVVYVNRKKNYSLSSNIKESIFEINALLLKYRPTLKKLILILFKYDFKLIFFSC